MLLAIFSNIFCILLLVSTSIFVFVLLKFIDNFSHSREFLRNYNLFCKQIISYKNEISNLKDEIHYLKNKVKSLQDK